MAEELSLCPGTSWLMASRPHPGAGVRPWGALVSGGVSAAGVAEAEGIGHDGDAAEGHGGTGDHGIEHFSGEGEEGTGGEGDACEIVGEGEEEVLADIAHDVAAEGEGAAEVLEVAFEEDHAGGLHGGVGA